MPLSKSNMIKTRLPDHMSALIEHGYIEHGDNNDVYRNGWLYLHWGSQTQHTHLPQLCPAVRHQSGIPIAVLDLTSTHWSSPVHEE